MTRDEQASLAALVVVGVAAAVVLLRPETARQGAPGAASGPILGTGGGITGGSAPDAPGEPEAGILETLTGTVGGWLDALTGGGGPTPVDPAKPKSPTEYRMLYRPLFRQLEKSYSMPVGLLEAIADRESRFRHDIISGQLTGGVGEQGIMQLHPQYHLNEAGRLDPYVAIPYAAKYLAQNFVKFGTWDEAIAAYNWGPGNVERSGIANAPAATKEYIVWVHDRDYVEGFV